MEHNYSNNYGNVYIRQLALEDIEQIRTWRNNPKNTKYLRRIPYITEEMQTKWFQNYLKDDDEMTFAIIENKSLNRVVGSLSLYNFENQKVEFGKILIGDDDAHGKKIAYQAIMAVADIVFNELKKEQIFLHVYKDNVAALNVYTNVGFVEREVHISDNKEELLMVLNKDDFKEMM